MPTGTIGKTAEKQVGHEKTTVEANEMSNGRGISIRRWFYDIPSGEYRPGKQGIRVTDVDEAVFIIEEMQARFQTAFGITFEQARKAAKVKQ